MGKRGEGGEKNRALSRERSRANCMVVPRVARRGEEDGERKEKSREVSRVVERDETVGAGRREREEATSRVARHNAGDGGETVAAAANHPSSCTSLYVYTRFVSCEYKPSDGTPTESQRGKAARTERAREKERRTARHVTVKRWLLMSHP